MALRQLAPALLQYSVIAPAVTAAVLFPVAYVAGAPIGGVATLLLLAALLIAPLCVATTDAGIVTAAWGAEAGFQPGNPMQYQNDAVPGRIEVGLYLLGLGAIAAVVLAALSV